MWFRSFNTRWPQLLTKFLESVAVNTCLNGNCHEQLCPLDDVKVTAIIIDIIITKNIRYLLWNRGLWRSMNNTYPLFLTPCIRCTNHLFLWLNWRKSTSYPVTAPNDSKCWPIVTSSIQEPVASNCDVTMTNSSRMVDIHAFLACFVTTEFQHGASLVYMIS